MSWETNTANEYLDLLDKLSAFLLKGHSLPPVYTGTGTGLINGIIGTAASVQETVTVTFSSATAFSVSGSVTGSMGSGTVGTAFSHAKVAFTVSAGGTAWASGDTISFVLTPPWQEMRRRYDTRFSAYVGDFTNVSYPAANAFDGSASSIASLSGSTGPHDIGVQLNRAATVAKFSLQASSTWMNQMFRDFALQYSDDGSAWTTAQSWTNQSGWGSSETRSYTVTGSPGSHAYWRLHVTANDGGSSFTIAGITLYDGTGASDTLPHGAEAIWKAPGNAGDDEIFVGVSTFFDATGQYYNWRLGGFTGFDAASAFGSQPGAMTRPCLPLWNAAIPYWFFADGKRVAIACKITTNYEHAYLGFIDSYLTPGEYAYPLAVGGSMSFGSEPGSTSTSWRYSYQGNEHQAYWKPYPSSATTSWNACQMRLRLSDGTWQGFQGYNLASGWVWPSISLGGMNNLKPNLDGSVPVFPLVLMDDDPNLYGEFVGLRYLSGVGQGSENTVTVGRDIYTVFQNASQTTVRDYVAILNA